MADDCAARGGFSPHRRLRGRRRSFVFIQLLAAVGLIASLAVAATAVSIGIARAQGGTVELVR